MLLTIDENAVRMTEAALKIERGYGTRPNDGTSAGQFMAEQEVWLEAQRQKIANAKAEAHSYYVLNK